MGLLDFSLVPPALLPSFPPRRLSSMLQPRSSLPCFCRPPAQEMIRPPLLYAPAEIQFPVFLPPSCTRNNKATSAPRAGRDPCFCRLFSKILPEAEKVNAVVRNVIKNRHFLSAVLVSKFYEKVFFLCFSSLLGNELQQAEHRSNS